MCVDEARPRRLRRQLISEMAVGRDFKALLLRSTIYGRRNNLTMPVDEFRSIRVVEKIDGHRNALLEADERSRNRSVVPYGANRVLLGDISQHSADPKCYIGRTTGCGPVRPRATCPSAC